MFQELRELVHAVPFVPFAVVLPNGQSVPVPHPDFIWLHPDKRSVHIALKRGGTRILSVQMIGGIDTKRVRA